MTLYNKQFCPSVRSSHPSTVFKQLNIQVSSNFFTTWWRQHSSYLRADILARFCGSLSTGRCIHSGVERKKSRFLTVMWIHVRNDVRQLRSYYKTLIWSRIWFSEQCHCLSPWATFKFVSVITNFSKTNISRTIAYWYSRCNYRAITVTDVTELNDCWRSFAVT